ncbi:MAG: YncE family protein [Nitrososphaeraceae archaeon]
MSLIDGDTNNVIGNIPVGMQPIGIVFNPSNLYVYVANAEINADPHTVSVIDSSTKQVIDDIVIPSSDVGIAIPIGLSFNPINDYVYLSTTSAERVYAIAYP